MQRRTKEDVPLTLAGAQCSGSSEQDVCGVLSEARKLGLNLHWKDISRSIKFYTWSHPGFGILNSWILKSTAITTPVLSFESFLNIVRKSSLLAGPSVAEAMILWFIMRFDEFLWTVLGKLFSVLSTATKSLLPSSHALQNRNTGRGDLSPM